MGPPLQIAFSDSQGFYFNTYLQEQFLGAVGISGQVEGDIVETCDHVVGRFFQYITSQVFDRTGDLHVFNGIYRDFHELIALAVLMRVIMNSLLVSLFTMMVPE